MGRLDSVGRPMAECDVRVVDDDGRPLPAGAEGEIAILTPSRMLGYFDNPEATRRTIDDDGWLRTGDVGRIDEDGFLHVLDRMNDVIIRGGFNVYPAEVEAALIAHPRVVDVAVVGAPHAVLGEGVVAFVVLGDGAGIDEDELVRFCRERVADYKCPREIRFVAELPRNAMGKVLRRTLREELVGEAA
ncbi:long-chain fatty acid--CoA ligase [Baekduia soli]|uniref:Long-chain fatty acid--CoA ligase n=1 Tax=Baekduia soli TaxID=496014 RepID=A0A5B8U2L5_9ACTN|nr:AMP-binding protein [Baekduia soli]QEC47256.1 long-chain fatty acid--CoA ligase [Baekduia soli]